MSGHVLVINAGSSSLRYRLVAVDDGTATAWGLVDRVGEPGSMIHHHPGHSGELRELLTVDDHDAAMRGMLDAFDRCGPALADAGVQAVGHRVVHGGDRFAAPVVIDDAVEAAIEELIPLAPLHNPANLEGIQGARRLFPDLPQVAVFDTAFHQTLPPYAYTYAVPRAWERHHGVRRYGFHGTSHSYVSKEAARLLGREPPDVNVIVLHLGNGASAAAVQGGLSVDTSMGLTPLQGLVMGTRSGDLDPGVPGHLGRTGGMSLDEIDIALNRESGMRGLTGVGDLRRVEAMAEDGDSEAMLALSVYCYRIRCYVGAYMAALGRVDAVAFTAGVGENSPIVRAQSLEGLAGLGIGVDPLRNRSARSDARLISDDSSRVAVLVIPTDEELEIARQTMDLL